MATGEEMYENACIIRQDRGQSLVTNATVYMIYATGFMNKHEQDR